MYRTVQVMKIVSGGQSLPDGHTPDIRADVSGLEQKLEVE